MKNVGMIVEEGICTGCCECLRACNRNNILMIYSFELGHPVPCISGDCCECGECVKSCESREVATAQIM